MPCSTNYLKFTAPRQFIDEHGRNARRFTRLLQRQNLEQLVHRSEAAGEHDKRRGAHGEVRLAHREVMEAERQLGGRVGIRLLLRRHRDVESNGWRTGLGCSPVSACRAAPASRSRALPNTTIVDMICQRLSACSAVEYSSRNRTPRIESLSRSSWSRAARR
jgi:hypothetical protein